MYLQIKIYFYKIKDFEKSPKLKNISEILWSALGISAVLIYSAPLLDYYFTDFIRIVSYVIYSIRHK